MRVVGKPEVIQLDEKSPMLRLARPALQRLLPPGRPTFTDSADPDVVNVHRFRHHSLPRHGTDHDSKPLPSFPGFCLPARLRADKESIEVGRATAPGFGPQSARAAICRRLVTTNSPNGAWSSFPCGGLVFLLYTMRRVDCRRFGVVTVEEVPWGDGKRTLIKPYMLFLSPLGAAAVMERDGGGLRTSWDKVFGRGRTCRHWGLEHRTLGQIDAIGVDEIQY